MYLFLLEFSCLYSYLAAPGFTCSRNERSLWLGRSRDEKMGQGPRLSCLEDSGAQEPEGCTSSVEMEPAGARAVAFQAGSASSALGPRSPGTERAGPSECPPRSVPRDLGPVAKARSVGRALVPLPILEKQNKNSGSSASAGDPRAKGDFPKFVCTPEEVGGLEGLLVVPRLGVLVEFRQRREVTLGLFTGRHACRLKMMHTVSTASRVLSGIK